MQITTAASRIEEYMRVLKAFGAQHGTDWSLLALTATSGTIVIAPAMLAALRRNDLIDL